MLDIRVQKGIKEGSFIQDDYDLVVENEYTQLLCKMK